MELALITTKIITPITVLFLLLVVAFLSLRIKKSIHETDKHSDQKFFELFEKQLNSDLIKDKLDLEILANSVAREFRVRYSLVPLLENFLKYSIEAKESSLTPDHYSFVKNIIIQENEDKPYSGIPEEERRILVNIRDSIKNDDKDATLFNLDELKNILSTRNTAYEKTIATNKWSVPLAIVGVVCTIVFGLFSIKQTLKGPSKN